MSPPKDSETLSARIIYYICKFDKVFGIFKILYI